MAYEWFFALRWDTDLEPCMVVVRGDGSYAIVTPSETNGLNARRYSAGDIQEDWTKHDLRTTATTALVSWLELR